MCRWGKKSGTISALDRAQPRPLVRYERHDGVVPPGATPQENTDCYVPSEGDSPMATDYDAPRKTEDEISEDSIEELKNRRIDKSSGIVDVDESELAESLELPGADLSNEELAVRVLPRQADEFTCGRCFLVHHRSQLAKEEGGQLICRDCAA
jgi:hypothetical protein